MRISAKCLSVGFAILILGFFVYDIAVFANPYRIEDPIIGQRTITFFNKCSFPVWFGFISGATASKNGGICQSDNDCRSGSVCVSRGSASNYCFWRNPAPADGQFRLEPYIGTNSVHIPIYNNEDASIWSGASAGRTNCNAVNCETADCGAGEGSCPSGRGFMQPATQAEFTFGKWSPDYYDVEVINGINLPIEMIPTFMAETKNITKNGCDDPYFCGAPGALHPVSQVGRCKWDLTPPSNDYKWVSIGGSNCRTDTDCNNEICGLSWSPARNPHFQKTCGRLLGYWTANQVCAMDASYTPFGCTERLPAPQQNLDRRNLYGCTQIGSCYQNGANNTCCGCANWDQIGVSVPASPYTKQCNNSNVNWVTWVQPTLKWLKLACPTVYTYPYDDMSSTFICSQLKEGINKVDYTITFCPGGQTAGITGTINKT